MDAGVYTRISSDSEGEGKGVARQEEDCRALAGQLGWVVVDVYRDNDVSATRSKIRPEYERMMADARSGRIGGVVVWAIDRLTRTPRELENVIDIANSTGLKLANATGRSEIDLSTSIGRTSARMMGIFARLETENQSARLKRKYEQKAQAGEPHGFAPYGFERRVPEGGTIGLDFAIPEQAEIIREAAKRTLSRESLRSIAMDFDARGIPTPRGGKWNSTVLRQILVRPANAGLRQHRGEVVGESKSEKIISVELYHQLVAFLSDPSRKSNFEGATPKYLLSGIARCGACWETKGGRMRRLDGRSQKQANGTFKRQPPAYNCSACFKIRRNQAKVEEVVVAVIVARLSKPDAMILIGAASPQEALDAQSALDALDAQLALGVDMFSDGEMNREQFKRLNESLEGKKIAAARRLAIARPSSPLTNLAGAPDVQAAWDVLPLGAQRDVVDSLITVTILPVGSGARFNPESVQIDWKN
ncbi:recombinase family protein [Glaciibacter psychrotolerans]|uniref:DNA invertase Pin-like site-specific DNA recombinase n=1 Tax=Glaciibacter psychrotolerans TaxID=670054 RepID=A0A7Z0J5P3_9MICO|nr:recombinase family protein [Leifsonia psychrotolerans]NYJ19625.1 DNA invertase Pin-like site-specific DNA recombinase [Leifsonia psychrotolerans]